ncbi:MAG: hypothetical protein LBH98_03160 [Chitinispirillales bacterium]|jgi:hypothetical protein|nr:hypothetical protein [Chitinispirillales bacterium]
MIQNPITLSLSSEEESLSNIEFVLTMNEHEYTFLIQRNPFDNSFNDAFNNLTFDSFNDSAYGHLKKLVYGDGTYGVYPYKNEYSGNGGGGDDEEEEEIDVSKKSRHTYYMTVLFDDETVLATGILITQYNNLLAGEIIGGWEMYAAHKTDPDKNRPVDTEFFNEWNIIYGVSI